LFKDIKIAELFNVQDIKSLKSYGSYQDIKNTIEEHIGFKLGVRGWKTLLKKLMILKKNSIENLELIKKIITEYPFYKAKKELSLLLDVKIKIKVKKDFNIAINLLISIFSKLDFDPAKEFENNKLENFKSSSRLESLEISHTTESLDDILKKHKKVS